MITRQIVEMLARMLTRRAELPRHFGALFIVRRLLVTGEVAKVQHYWMQVDAMAKSEAAEPGPAPSERGAE